MQSQQTCEKLQFVGYFYAIYCNENATAD